MIIYPCIPIHLCFQKISNRYFFSTLKKGPQLQNNWWILPYTELDLYFIIIYPCIKYESNTLIFSKDNERKPFLLRTHGMDVHTDSSDTICPHIENGGGIKTWNDNTLPLSCSGHITVKNWRNLPIRNPKPDLHNINAHIKFGKNSLRFIQLRVHFLQSDHFLLIVAW